MPSRTPPSSLARPRFLARSGGIRSLAAILPWLLVASPTRAQQIEAAYLSASSPNPEFPEADGGEIEGLFELGHGWQLDLGLRRIWARTEKEMQVCRVYHPRVSCQIEETRNEMSLTGFRAGVMRSLLAVSHAEVKLGAGLSFNQPELESSTGLTSGFDGDVYMPSGGQVGALGLLTLDVTPAPSIGLAITLGAVAHWVNFDACSEENRYDPFCSPATFRELQVGVAYSPPR